MPCRKISQKNFVKRISREKNKSRDFFLEQIDLGNERRTKFLACFPVEFLERSGHSPPIYCAALATPKALMAIHLKAILIVCVALFKLGNAHAAAFSMEGSSPSALGNAFAGSVTGSHDNSDAFFNPATLRSFKNAELNIGATNVRSTIDATANSSMFSDNIPRTGSTSASGGTNTTVPSIYFSTPLNANWSFGINITSPFAGRTTYPNDWLGRFHALDTNIKTVNVNPQLAYQVNDALAIGFGFQYQRMDATVSRDTSPTTYGVYQGKADQYGFTFGVLARATPDLKLGLGYRSAMRHKLQGNVDLTSLVNGAAQTIPGSVDLTMPEMLTLGAAYQASEKMEWVTDLRMTRWSRVSVFRIQLQRAAGGVIEVPLPFRDSVLASVGMNYRFNDTWLLRTGVAYEKEAVTDDMRNPRLPLGDSSWLSFGLQYKVNEHAHVNFSFAHQFYKDTQSNFPASAARASASLDANYRLSTNIIGASFNYAW